MNGDDMGRTCSTSWEENKCIQDCSTEPKGKRRLEISGHRWKDNIKMTQK